MEKNFELKKRFVNDYDLPIPIIGNGYNFEYHVNLYEEDFNSLTLYNKTLNEIKENFDNKVNEFLNNYYEVRENIIQTITKSQAFQKFNEMDMNVYSIKNKVNITSNNIYNQSNIGKFFISVDLKKANFQVLNKIDKEILLNSASYKELIEHFTDSEYIANSKYFRNVVFGMMNPKRHITAEKYFITQIYKKVIEQFPYLADKCVSLSNDEIIFNVNFLFYNDKFTCFAFRKQIEEIAMDMGFEVRVDFFHLKGYNLVFKESRSVRKTFYIKDYFCTDEKFKLIAAPLPYHAMIYKLYKKLPLEEIDYHFDYEGMNARFCEEFDVEEVICLKRL